jgi:CheY-like chemotaxis protein
VADDNFDAASMLAEYLELLGHQVWTASDGQDALEKTESLKPEVVVLDLGMPRMDGYEAARRIRATALGPHLTLIALTGWGQESDRARTRDAGFDWHVVKPVDPDALGELLQRAREPQAGAGGQA